MRCREVIASKRSHLSMVANIFTSYFCSCENKGGGAMRKHRKQINIFGNKWVDFQRDYVLLVSKYSIPRLIAFVEN